VKISQATLKEVKAIVEAYLPGLDDAEFLVSEQLETAHSQANQAGAIVKSGKSMGGMVVTVSKSVQVSRRTFHHYARVTLNDKGKMVKLVVSR
jgi:hypothetical protein